MFSTQQKLRLCTFFTLICLGLTACTHRMFTQINEDGSGKALFELGFTEEENLVNGKEFFASADDCKNYFNNYADDVDLPDSYAVTYEEREGKKWCVIRANFDSFEELALFYKKGISTESNTIVKRDNKIVYNIPFPTDGNTFDNESAWTLSLPGEIQEHNADKLIGNTLTWNLDHPIDNFYAVSNISAPSQQPNQSFGAFLANNLCVVLIGLIASIISIWTFVKERR